jgi:hypothetical protein
MNSWNDGVRSGETVNRYRKIDGVPLAFVAASRMLELAECTAANPAMATTSNTTENRTERT